MEIDGLLTGFNDEVLRARGFVYSGQIRTMDGVRHQQVTMELREENNNTRVACVGRDDHPTRRDDVNSPVAYVTILGMLQVSCYIVTVTALLCCIECDKT
jgi:hypothetical protein